MELAAGRENAKVRYLQRLQGLGGKAGGNAVALPAPPKSTRGRDQEDGSERTLRTRDLDVEIEIAPEDIGRGAHD
ncbi:MAG: hypothetical protein WAM61_12805 [Desulfobacterales bacterium]